MTRRLAYILGTLALVSSGTYMFIYLYRWEWNRAVMAGVIFIAAEIALAAAAILERIKSIEKTLSASKQDELKRLEIIHQNSPEPADRFAWLSENDSLNVFVPFLMGAGLIASGLAWLVERLAGATAKPVLEQRLAMRLAPISMPAGGLVPASGAALGAGRLPNAGRRVGRSTLYKQVAALIFALMAGTIGLDRLSDATQTRPDVILEGTQSAVVVDITVNGSAQTEKDTIRALWGACRATVPAELTGPIAATGSTFQLNLQPTLGKNAERRFRGCLQDATLDNVSASVISVTE